MKKPRHVNEAFEEQSSLSSVRTRGSFTSCTRIRQGPDNLNRTATLTTFNLPYKFIIILSIDKRNKMVSFRFCILAIIASFFLSEVSALANKGPRFSLSEQAALSQGEASLLGSSSTFYGNQPLWSGKKNAENAPFRGKNEDQSKSFTPRTKSNQSSFVPKKP